MLAVMMIIVVIALLLLLTVVIVRGIYLQTLTHGESNNDNNKL